MPSTLMHNWLEVLKDKTRLGGVLILVSSLVFCCIACDNADRTTGVATAPEEVAEVLPPGEGLDIGALAPNFSLPDSRGEFQSLSEYRGQTLVIVFYRTGT